MPSENTAQTDYRALLSRLLERARAAERAFTESLSAEERERVGTAQTWAPKEIIAHLGWWKDAQAQRIESVARGEESLDTADFERLNAESWPDLARLKWAESLARLAAGTDALLAAFPRLPAVEIERLAGVPGQPEALALSTLGNGFDHPYAHIADMQAARGDPEGAERSRRAVVSEMMDAGAPPVFVGNARYNLACNYALAGRRDEALSELRQALRLRPDLVGWAQEDSDLASLRDDSAFRALVAPAGADGAAGQP